MVYLTLEKFVVKFYSDSADERELVRKSLTFLHPNPQEVPSFKKGHWDGLIKKLKTFTTFSVGMLPYVVDRLKKENVTIVWEAFDKPDLSWVKFSEGISVESRDYQRNSILAFLEKRIGIIKVPTRGGKTYIAGELVRLMIKRHAKMNVLFLTDSKDVFDPVRKDLGSFIGKTATQIGEVREKKREYQQVTVAMIQTLQSALKSTEKHRPDRGLVAYLKTVDFLIIDEIHEYYSTARQKIINRIQKNVSYQLSLSASPYKESDPLGWLNVQEMTGGIIYDIHQKELEARGVLAKNKVLLIFNKIRPKDVNEKLGYMENVSIHIHNSENRNRLIRMIIQACEKLGLKTMIMFSSKKHGYLISEQTGKAFLSGDDDAQTRTIIKEAFLELDGEILLVSEIWKKAITLPEVEVFVNADGGKEATAVIQKKGRVLGTTANKKKALVIDIIDSCSKYFSDHSVSRLTVYEDSNTSDEIDIIDYDDNLLKNLIAYLKEWFND